MCAVGSGILQCTAKLQRAWAVLSLCTLLQCNWAVGSGILLHCHTVEV